MTANGSSSVLMDSAAQCEALLARGRKSIAGGDSSSMRVLPYHLPLVAQRGEGCRVWDADGREYIDLNMAYGPLLFGHRPDFLVEAVIRQIAEQGSMLGFPTELSMRVAEKVKRLFPSIELLRFANSGTEAMCSAVRLARTITGRSKIILFEGHYHGWSDPLFHQYHAPVELLEAGQGQARPGTAGMNGAPRDVLLLEWNDLDAQADAFRAHSGHVAAVVMEPVMGNSGLIPPLPGFLEGVRTLTRESGTMLVFDEVITGMRVAAGGAQERYGVRPDITVISKALGGGYPVAAFGASAQIMQMIVNGTLFHGGVYSGNATSMAAADAVLDAILADPAGMYRRLEDLAVRLARGLEEIMTRLEVPHLVRNVGPIVSLFLLNRPVRKLNNYRDVRRNCDFPKYIEFQHRMQRAGVYFHPNQFETMFLSTAHTVDDIDEALQRIDSEARACLTT
jgi:glutamate-1-semialdehyde 2,1-aminomutase